MKLLRLGIFLSNHESRMHLLRFVDIPNSRYRPTSYNSITVRIGTLKLTKCVF